MSKKPVPPQPSEPAANDGEAMAAVKEMSEAKKRWKPNATQIGIGAAAVGSAAVVAAMLYWRGGKK